MLRFSRLSVLALGLAAPVAMTGPVSAEPPSGTTTYFGANKTAAPDAPAQMPALAPANLAPAAAKAAAEAAPAPPASPQAATTVAATPPAAADPVVEAARAKLKDKAITAKAAPDDVAALSALYATRSAPLWLKDGALSDAGKAVVAELKAADTWGLEASAFDVVEPAGNAPADVLAEADVRLALAALKYARVARSGRVDPLSISPIWDMKPPQVEPKAVLDALMASATPDAVLRTYHPKHDGFAKLREALAKARGPQTAEAIDPALLVKLPADKAAKTVKPGTEHDDVALLRKRLKIEAQSPANEKLLDAKLEAAIREFQGANELKVNGELNAKTRAALNRAGEPKTADPKSEIDRILVNMERWRWLPEDLGGFYVMNNVPEFRSRVVKAGAVVLDQKIIAGQPTWPTPMLVSSLQSVVFHPEWGVPDGIKVKELLPRLKRASAQGGGGGFFDQLFNGGSASGGARVLAAYKLNPTLNGRPVDANSINWNQVDIRRFSFVQPAGAANPLGVVKFLFPNKHDVYMHDTPQKALFARSARALSHGCMRLEQPKRMAEVLLAEDKGWGADKVSAQYGGSTNDVRLSSAVPVYLTYFTARVGEDGRLATFGDIYGHDSRLLQALAGRPMRYTPPTPSQEPAVSDAGDGEEVASPVEKKTTKKQAASKPKAKKGDTVADILGDALSGLISN